MSRAALVLLVPLAGCDILFQIREVKRIDAGPPMEASVDAPDRCPFSDTFDDNTISPAWQVNDPMHTAGFATEKDGALDIALNGTAGYNGIFSATTHDMTGMIMRATAYPMNQIGYSETFMQIAVDPTNYVRFATGAGNITFIAVVSAGETRTTTPYNPALHRHWRFRHDAVAQLMYFEVSGDGITFQIARTVAIPFALDAARPGFLAGTYQMPPTSVIIGSARYDDFSVCPP